MTGKKVKVRKHPLFRHTLAIVLLKRCPCSLLESLDLELYYFFITYRFFENVSLDVAAMYLIFFIILNESVVFYILP